MTRQKWSLGRTMAYPPVAAIVLVSVLVCASCAHDQRARMGTAPKDGASALGTIRLACGADKYWIRAGGPERTIVTFSSDENPVQAPPGNCVLLDARFESKDAEGAVWRLSARPGQVGKPFVVKAGETTIVECGPPLTAVLPASRFTGDMVNFSVFLTGRGGLAYTADAFLRNGTLTTTPSIEIRDANGELMATGAFKYG